MHPSLRVVEREWSVYRRLWRTSVVSTFLQPLLYLSALGLGLGTLVDRGTGAEALDVAYVVYIAPGVLAATAMQTAAGQSTWGVMMGTKWIGWFHGLVASPVRPGDIVAGYLTWSMVRVLISTAAFALVLTLFGIVGPLRALAAIAPVLLTALAFAGPLTAWSATIVEESGQFPALFRFGIVPMFLFAGVFFPISQLPDWLEPVALATPLWHGVELTRAVALGGTTRVPPWSSIAYLVLLALGGAAVATRTFRRRLTP